jgi:hypothetical protein
MWCIVWATIAPLAQSGSWRNLAPPMFFFTCQDKKYFQSEQIFEVEKKTAKMKSALSKD